MGDKWKLGDDLYPDSNLLDPITFQDVILMVHHNCREITEDAVRKQVKNLLTEYEEEMESLLNNNINEIIEEAKKGRGDYSG